MTSSKPRHKRHLNPNNKTFLRERMMTAQLIDIHEELAEAKVGKFHRRLGAMMGLLTLFDGYDTFNPAYVIHYVARPWGLQAGQAGLLISSGLVGFLIGAAIHGIVADRLGRRGTLLGGLWITSIFTLLTATKADSFQSFCILRILTGVGLGVLLPLATTYINELAPRRVANTFALWGVALGWALGGTLAGIAGVFATPVFGWTALYWIGSLSFLLLPFMHLTLPESPKFLALRGRTGEIRDMLAKLRPERAGVYLAAEIAVGQPERPVNSVAALLQAKYRRTTFAIWASAFLSLFCIFGLSGWIPTVMMQRGETFAASFGFGALMQIMSFVGALVLGHLVDRFGSNRGLLAIWWAIGGVAVLSLVVLNDHIVNVTSVAAAGFFIIGAQFVLNNFTAGSYETGVRATAVGMELGIGRVGAILGPLVAGALQQFYQSPTPMFVSIGLAAIAAGTIILLARRPSEVFANGFEASDNTCEAPQPAS
jgi:MFS family permease